MTGLSLLDRALGSFLGFAVGDALGATVEFLTPEEIRSRYGVHREIVGGGWLNLKPGEITDDTQMCLILGRSMLAAKGWDPRRAADDWVLWMRNKPVDIGHTVRRGLRRYLQFGTLESEPAEDAAGNGALVRNLPVSLSCFGDRSRLHSWSLEQARITHSNPHSDAAVIAFADLTDALLSGASKPTAAARAQALVDQYPEFAFDAYSGASSAYVIDTVRAALAAFFFTETFEDCLLKAVNFGGDSDTVGALAAQLAGAHYGLGAIPARWLRRMDSQVVDSVGKLTSQLLRLSPHTEALLASPMPTLARATGLRRWF